MPKIKLYNGRKLKLRPNLLLHPQIPKPLHGISPRILKGKEWWDKERRKAYKKANYYCQACGVHKTEAKIHQWLEAHECYEIDYYAGIVTFKEIVALCHCCHSYIHRGRLDKLYMSGQVLAKNYNTIVNHGDKVLKKAKLKPLDFENDEYIEWDKWRLIIGKKKYKSKFKSYEEWAKHYSE